MHADDVAYILYTSGSTGQPKGCVLTHGNLAAAIDNLQGALESAVPASDAGAPFRLLARSAEAFDVHLCECFIALKSGATIVTMPRAVLLQDLGKVIATGRVTHACVVPSLFYTEGRRIAPADVPTLRALTIGGEKLPEDVVHTWGAQTRVPMLNAYGPTEATIGISAARVRATTLPSCIGAAFPGNQFVVLVGAGQQRRLALRGEAGELCIVGSHVGRGYVLLIGVLMPIVLAYIWLSWIMKVIAEGYEGYPGDFLGVFGWGIALGSVALAILLSLIPWSRKSNLYAEDLDSEIHGDLIPHNAVPEGTVPTGALPVVPAAATRKEL